MTKLKHLISVREGVKTELKLSFNDAVIETLVAFANTSGGTDFLGLDDKGGILSHGRCCHRPHNFRRLLT